jgi:ribonuclease BN (tRNA processing enzyme)
MRLVVLGSCGGYLVPGRACSGYLVEAGQHRLWLDAGSGTLSHLLARCSLAELAGVWLTHLHPDHWTDLPLAVHALALGAAARSLPLPIYGPHGWLNAIGASVQAGGVVREPLFAANELRDGMAVDLGSVTVESVAVEHEIETYGFRVTMGGSVIAYSADSGPCDALVRLANEADLFLCEVGTEAESSRIHLNARQAGEIASAARARKLLLTHLPPGADPAEALNLARASYAGKIDVAIDGAEYEVESAR